MKKLLAAAAIVGAFSTLSVDTYAVSGEFQTGFEFEDYAGEYKDSTFILPFVGTKLYPVEGSPFYVEAKYSYRYRDTEEKRATDRRRRYELYTGYAWRWDRFAFTPKVGVRFEDYASSSTGQSSREATNDTVAKWRFYPNMSYKLTDNASMFLSGFVSYVQSDLNDTKQRKDGEGNDSGLFGEKYDDYNHELESGVRYRLPNSQQLQVSLYSEYTREKNNASTEEWQLRLRYNHKLENGKTTLSPWVRIGLDRETRDRTGRGYDDRDRTRHRIGLTASHNVTNDFSIFGEINWQTARVESNNSDGSTYRRADEERTLYKLGFKQKF